MCIGVILLVYVWFEVMRIMMFTAILTHCTILGLSSNQLLQLLPFPFKDADGSHAMVMHIGRWAIIKTCISIELYAVCILAWIFTFQHSCTTPKANSCKPVYNCGSCKLTAKLFFSGFFSFGIEIWILSSNHWDSHLMFQLFFINCSSIQG